MKSWRKMDNDSADITLSGRSFLVSGPATGKLGCQLDPRHCQTVGGTRMERLATRQVGDVVERTEVLRRESMQDFVHQNDNLVGLLNWVNSLRHAQPVEAVRSTEMARQSRSRVQHRLESTGQIDRKTGQHAIAVIDTR